MLTFIRRKWLTLSALSTQLDGLRLEREKVEKIYLTFEEIEKIENKTDLLDHLDNARDWLIISCFTGQRVSDFLRFTKDMIREKKMEKNLLSLLKRKQEN